MALRARLFAVIAAGALVAAACGNDDATEPTGEGSDTATSSNGEGEWEPEWVDGVLQPLPDGFPDHDLTILNVQDAGTPDGIYARTFQQALDGLSPVPVRVVDQPLGPMIQYAGIDFVGQQADGKDGYWPIVTPMTGNALKVLTEPVEPELGLTVEDMNPVIVTELIPFVLVARADAPFDSYEDMVTWAQDNPGELRYISYIVGSGLDIEMERLMMLDEFEAEKIPLSDLAMVPTTVAAGDGDVAMVAADAARAQYDAGNLKVLLTVGADESPAPWEDVPTDRDLGYNEPLASQRGFMVHPETPDLHRDWLYELFRAGSETDVYQQRITTTGAQSLAWTHEEAKEVAVNAVELAEPIIRDLGLHYEQRQ